MQRRVALSLSALSVILILLSFHLNDMDTMNDTVNDTVNRHYEWRMDDFHQAAQLYVRAAKKQNPNEIREAHRACRLTFKRAEHLLNYWDRSFIKLHINGAPLPVVRTQRGEVIVEEPEGLQILDELISEASLDYELIQQKAMKLEESIATILPHEKRRTFTDQYVLEAMRNQLIRIMTLGITGFDTPGSLNALEEARVSLDAMLCDLESYRLNEEASSFSAWSSSMDYGAASIQYLLERDDFNTLSRTELIRDYLDPLYGALLSFHKAAGYKIKSEEEERYKSVSYQAESIFSEDFLNPYYYTGLKQQDDNQEMSALGALLFYDPALSSGNNISCASCHKPKMAFTDGLTKSISAHGNTEVLRNSPTLINSIHSTRFFYDLRSSKLEEQLIDVINNEDEFNITAESLAQKLLQSEEYTQLFRSAFQHITWDKEDISSYKIVAALSSYVLSLRSQNSTFDRYMRREVSTIDSEVKEGFDLFMGKAACGTCHFPPTFSGLLPDQYDENETEVLGVPADSEASELDIDEGRIANGWKHERAEHYRHSFKTVTVRNSEVTAPYMHNGVYQNMEQVLEFYDRGGGAGHGLEVPYQTLAEDPLNLTSAEKSALISFMNALTDTSVPANVPDRLPAFEGGLSELDRSVGY